MVLTKLCELRMFICGTTDRSVTTRGEKVIGVNLLSTWLPSMLMNLSERSSVRSLGIKFRTTIAGKTCVPMHTWADCVTHSHSLSGKMNLVGCFPA